METREIVIRFPGANTSDGNQLADDLRQYLLDSVSGIQVEKNREDSTSMDFGATLILVLGAPATLIVARAIHKWASRSNAARIDFSTKDGTLSAKNIESKDVAAIAKALTEVSK